MSATAARRDTAATADAVFALLGDGLKSFDQNWKAAKASLQRAYAMLEAERAGDTAKSVVARGGLAPWQMRKSEAFIMANLDRPFTIARLAQEARLSPQHYSRSFRQSFGESPHAYVSARRVERAKHLMLTTTDALSQIALDCGYADQAHFTRRFHDTVGTPPNAWRREAAP